MLVYDKMRLTTNQIIQNQGRDNCDNQNTPGRKQKEEAKPLGGKNPFFLFWCVQLLFFTFNRNKIVIRKGFEMLISWEALYRKD